MSPRLTLSPLALPRSSNSRTGRGSLLASIPMRSARRPPAGAGRSSRAFDVSARAGSREVGAAGESRIAGLLAGRSSRAGPVEVALSRSRSFLGPGGGAWRSSRIALPFTRGGWSRPPSLGVGGLSSRSALPFVSIRAPAGRLSSRLTGSTVLRTGSSRRSRGAESAALPATSGLTSRLADSCGRLGKFRRSSLATADPFASLLVAGSGRCALSTVGSRSLLRRSRSRSSRVSGARRSSRSR